MHEPPWSRTFANLDKQNLHRKGWVHKRRPHCNAFQQYSSLPYTTVNIPNQGRRDCTDHQWLDKPSPWDNPDRTRITRAEQCHTRADGSDPGNTNRYRNRPPCDMRRRRSRHSRQTPRLHRMKSWPLRTRTRCSTGRAPSPTPHHSISSAYVLASPAIIVRSFFNQCKRLIPSEIIGQTTSNPSPRSMKDMAKNTRNAAPMLFRGTTKRAS